MSALVVLISASFLLAIGFLIAFISATKKGQYDDVYTPSVRILFEEPAPDKKTASEKKKAESLPPSPALKKELKTKTWN